MAGIVTKLKAAIQGTPKQTITMSAKELQKAIGFIDRVKPVSVDIEGVETGFNQALTIFARKFSWHRGWHRTGEYEDITDWDSV